MAEITGEGPRISARINRRDFLKLGLAALGGAAVAELKLDRLFTAPNPLSQTPELIMPNAKDSLLNFFVSKRIAFKQETIQTQSKHIDVFNGSGGTIDTNKLSELYAYYEKLPKNKSSYRLTDASHEATVIPSTRAWQKKGTLLIVPMDADLPDTYAHLRANDAFTDYVESGDQFITVIRIPNDEYARRNYGLTRAQYVQASSAVEAAQASVYVTLEGTYGIGLPSSEERLLTQEAYCNSFWYILYNRYHNVAYDPILSAKTTFPSKKTSLGGSLSLRSMPIDREEYMSMPTNPYFPG